MNQIRGFFVKYSIFTILFGALMASSALAEDTGAEDAVFDDLSAIAPITAPGDFNSCMAGQLESSLQNLSSAILDGNDNFDPTLPCLGGEVQKLSCSDITIGNQINSSKLESALESTESAANQFACEASKANYVKSQLVCAQKEAEMLKATAESAEGQVKQGFSQAENVLNQKNEEEADMVAKIEQVSLKQQEMMQVRDALRALSFPSVSDRVQGQTGRPVAYGSITNDIDQAYRDLEIQKKEVQQQESVARSAFTKSCLQTLPAPGGCSTTGPNATWAEFMICKAEEEGRTPIGERRQSQRDEYKNKGVSARNKMSSILNEIFARAPSVPSGEGAQAPQGNFFDLNAANVNARYGAQLKALDKEFGSRMHERLVASVNSCRLQAENDVTTMSTSPGSAIYRQRERVKQFERNASAATREILKGFEEAFVQINTTLTDQTTPLAVMQNAGIPGGNIDNCMRTPTLQKQCVNSLAKNVENYLTGKTSNATALVKVKGTGKFGETSLRCVGLNPCITHMGEKIKAMTNGNQPQSLSSIRSYKQNFISASNQNLKASQESIKQQLKNGSTFVNDRIKHINSMLGSLQISPAIGNIDLRTARLAGGGDTLYSLDGPLVEFEGIESGNFTGPMATLGSVAADATKNRSNAISALNDLKDLEGKCKVDLAKELRDERREAQAELRQAMEGWEPACAYIERYCKDTETVAQLTGSVAYMFGTPELSEERANSHSSGGFDCASPEDQKLFARIPKLQEELTKLETELSGLKADIKHEDSLLSNINIKEDPVGHARRTKAVEDLRGQIKEKTKEVAAKKAELSNARSKTGFTVGEIPSVKPQQCSMVAKNAGKATEEIRDYLEQEATVGGARD